MNQPWDFFSKQSTLLIFHLVFSSNMNLKQLWKKMSLSKRKIPSHADECLRKDHKWGKTISFSPSLTWPLTIHILGKRQDGKYKLMIYKIFHTVGKILKNIKRTTLKHINMFPKWNSLHFSKYKFLKPCLFCIIWFFSGNLKPWRSLQTLTLGYKY